MVLYVESIYLAISPIIQYLEQRVQFNCMVYYLANAQMMIKYIKGLLITIVRHIGFHSMVYNVTIITHTCMYLARVF